MASADALDVQDKMQKAMKDMVSELDKTRLRKIQLKMHQCAAKCCQNESASLEQAQRCVEDCSTAVQAAHHFVQQEIGQFQERIQRCIMQCQDNAKDKLSPDASDHEMDKTKAEFESCAIKCANDHMNLIPNLVKKMQKGLDMIK